jgi:hypothetical protein
VTEDALEEWREHPVTIEIMTALGNYLDARESSAVAAYWGGVPIPEAERVSIRRQMDLWARIFKDGPQDYEDWIVKPEKMDV